MQSLGDIMNFKNGKKRPNTAGTIPVYGGNGVLDFTNAFNSQNCIVIGRVGAYCGSVFRERSKCWVSDNAICCTTDDTSDIDYAYYLLKGLQLNKRHIGTSQPLLTQEILNKIEILCPPFAEQQRIGKFLLSLDNKIKLNQRINDNLQKQAQALFNDWFVAFAPFGDEEFVMSPAGTNVPKSLQMKQIADIPHVLETGKRPKGGAAPSGIPSVGAENVKQLGQFNFSSNKFIPVDFAARQKTGKITGYELLLYKDGGKPGTFIPHFSMFGEGFPYKEFFINEHVFKLDFFDRGKNEFAYFYMQTDYPTSWLANNGGKAAIPGINQQDVNAIWIYDLEHPKIKQFCEWVQPLFKTIFCNCYENLQLAKLRDTLLPKLMSGELDVSAFQL